MNYDLSAAWTAILAVLVLRELAWKSITLWKAVRRNQLGWFVALLFINSAGILPIIYLLTHREQVEPGEADHEAAVLLKG